MIGWIYLATALVSWRTFARAMYRNDGGEDMEDAIFSAGMGFVAAMLWPLAWLVLFVAWGLRDKTREDAR